MTETTNMEPLNGWPEEGSRIADTAHIHALGQLALTYNVAEDFLNEIFQVFLPTSPEYSERLFHELNNRGRIDLLTALIEQNEKDLSTKERLLAMILHFDICTQNRNILMHSHGVSNPGQEIMTWRKRASKNPSELIQFDIPLADLRRAADETSALVVFIAQMQWFLTRRRKGELNALPDTPPKPRILTPSRPEAVHTA